MGERAAGWLEAGVFLFAGVYMTLVGFRWVNPSRPSADPVLLEQWHRRYGWLMRLASPAGILLAAYKSIQLCWTR